MWLRHNTAGQTVLIGPFLDETDGKTPLTALTIANTDIKLFVEGASAEVSKNSGGATHLAAGRYRITLDDTDTFIPGKLEINVHKTGALPVRREFMIVQAAYYDDVALVANPALRTQLADGVVHGGATARMKLGGGDASNPSFYVTNSAGIGTLFESINGVEATGFKCMGKQIGFHAYCNFNLGTAGAQFEGRVQSGNGAPGGVFLGGRGCQMSGSASTGPGLKLDAFQAPGLEVQGGGNSVGSPGIRVFGGGANPSIEASDGIASDWIGNLINLLEADQVIRTDTTPWTLEYRLKGTATVLLTKQLKQLDGSNLTTAVVVGQKVE